jgi:hypothetical protein
MLRVSEFLIDPALGTFLRLRAEKTSASTAPPTPNKLENRSATVMQDFLEE